MTKTGLYHSWKGMKSRCNCPNNKSYADYGGRGIQVCEEWKKFFTFMEWALLHGYTDGLTIERKDVNGNYSPDNCKWIILEEQAKNRRTACNVVFITINGVIKSVSEWSKESGVSSKTIMKRYREQNWRDSDIIKLTRRIKSCQV